MPRKNHFVLLWWLKRKMTAIIGINRLPKPSNVWKMNEEIVLDWVNSSTKEKHRENAKILMFGVTKEELEKVPVDVNGNVCILYEKEVSEEDSRSMENLKVSKKDFQQDSCIIPDPLVIKTESSDMEYNFTDKTNDTCTYFNDDIEEEFCVEPSNLMLSNEEVDGLKINYNGNMERNETRTHFNDDRTNYPTSSTHVESGSNEGSSQNYCFLKVEPKDTYTDCNDDDDVDNDDSIQDCVSDYVRDDNYHNGQQNNHKKKSENTNVNKPNEVIDVGPQEFSFLFPNGVTLNNIQFMERLLVLMKRVYNTQKCGSSLTAGSEIPDRFTCPDEDKVELSRGSGIYLKASTKKYIEMHSYIEGKFDWKKLVRLTLQEVYGSEIAKFSATGKKANSRPAINNQLFNAIFEWASSLLEDGLRFSKKEFICQINKMSANKRKYQKSQTQQVSTSKKKKD